MRRRHARLLLGLALLLVAAVPPRQSARTLPVRTVDATPQLDRRSVVEGDDWATATFSDPWDYANAEDALVSPNGPTFQLDSASISGGQLRLSKGTRPGNAFLHYLVATGAIPLGRSGPAFAIPAAHHELVTLRLWASGPVSAALSFFECPVYGSPCHGQHPFQLRRGWQTVTLRPVDAFGLGGRWRGDVVGLRLELGDGPPAEVRVDWVRVHPDADPVQLTGTPGDAIWDTDRDLANNTVDAPGWGPWSEFRSDAVPPGTYHVAVDGRYVDTLEVLARPLPVVLDPDVTGGDDHAEVVLGDPWDLTNPADVLHVNADEVRFTADGLHARNRDNDPFLRLRIGDAGIDGDRYHRMTVTMDYDGDFDLRDAVDGGTHARVIWQRADTGHAFHNSHELLTFNERPTVTVDLATDPPGAVQEPTDAQRPGWTGSRITQLRWDVNEDRGRRRWRVRGIRLAADDEGRGSFTVRWRDPRHVEGTAVEVGLARSRGGEVEHVVARVPQVAGANAVRADLVDVPVGEWWVRVRGTAASGTVGDGWATGPLQVLPTAPRAERVAGVDRYDTGLALSRAVFPAATTAIVASGRSFPDALAGTALAAALDAPILLNPSDRLDPRVAAELRRLGTTRVLLLGGTGAQSDAVARALAEVVDDVARVAGPTRWDTAAEIARAVAAVTPGADDHAVLVAGTGFADALSAANLAGAADLPVLLTRPDVLPAATATALEDLGVRHVTVVGGTRVVGAQVVADLVGRGIDVVRRSGPDRYATNAAVVADALAAGATAGDVLVARGGDFPDALAAGAAAAARGGVLLLTPRTRVAAHVAAHVDDHSPTRLQLVGGSGAIADDVARALA